MNLEEHMEQERLRLEVRRAMQELPEVPPPAFLKLFRGLGAPAGAWKLGKQIQIDNPGSVPFTCEDECAAGLWAMIRRGADG